MAPKFPPEEPASLIPSGHNRQVIQPHDLNLAYAEDSGTQIDSSDLRKWWHVLCARKWLVIIVTAVVSMIVGFWVYGTNPKYEATTIVEVGKENTTVVQVAKDLIMLNDESIKTKKFILQSTPLLEDVVVSLQLDQRPGFLSTATGSARHDNQEPIERVAASPAVQQTGEANRSAQESDRLAPFVKMIAENLNVEEVRDTRLLSVSFKHTDPVLAAAVSNGVVQALMERSSGVKNEKFTKVSSWLDRQLNDLKAKVDQTERELADYTREHNITSSEGSDRLTGDELSRLNGEVMRAETDRILKESLYEEVKNGNIEQIPEAFTNPATVELKGKLNELMTKAAQLEVNYGPDNPQTIEVKQQIAAVQKQTVANNKSLEAKLKTDYERAVRDERALKGVLDQTTTGAVKQNETGIRYSILKHQFETAKALYAEFLQKSNQATFEVSQQETNLRVVQPAIVPKETSGPKRWQVAILGFLLALGTGVGLAFLRDNLDTTIKSTEHVKRYVQLPALAVIPPMAQRSFLGRNKSDQRTINGNGSIKMLGSGRIAMVPLNGSPAAEAYRVLRTSVLMSPFASAPKTILVTSSQPGDGKTTTTVNTAASLAQLGKLVLIIDCDLRTPRVHELLDANQSPGLSTYLSSDLMVEDVIQKLPTKNLSLLAAGPVPSNPAELLSSDRMNDLLQTLAGRYDHILIDSPPLINFADPLILSTKVDGVMLVIYGGKTTWDAALRARDDLLTVGANTFGVVLNNFDVKHDRYGYYQ